MSKSKPTSKTKSNKTAKSTKTSTPPSRTTITGPTIITLVRMVISIVFMFLVMVENTPARIFAFILFVAGAISDHVDGKWARRHEIVTDLGAFLDPLADKMLVNLAFLALVSMHIMPAWVFAIVLIRDFAVDGMRMMAAREGITISASFYGKLKTTIQLTAIIIILFNLIVNWAWLGVIGYITLAAAILLTIFSGADYLTKSWSKLISPKNK